MIGFGMGLPDPNLYPIETLDALLDTLPRGDGSLYNPAPAWGDPVLRETLSGWLRSRGIRAAPEEILVTTGGQQGLNVLSRAFITPGDVVLTENPTYPGAFLTFRWAGADVVGVPVDHDGVRVEALEEALARYRPKLIYLIPAFQNPTGAVLTAERRRRVLDLALQYRVPVVESDLYGDLYFEQEPPAALKAQDARWRRDLPGRRLEAGPSRPPGRLARGADPGHGCPHRRQDLRGPPHRGAHAAAGRGVHRQPECRAPPRAAASRVPRASRCARQRAPPALPATPVPGARGLVLSLGYPTRPAHRRDARARRARARRRGEVRHGVQPERRCGSITSVSATRRSRPIGSWKAPAGSGPRSSRS